MRSAPAGKEAAVSGDVAVVDALGQMVLRVVKGVERFVPQRQHTVRLLDRGVFLQTFAW